MHQLVNGCEARWRSQSEAPEESYAGSRCKSVHITQ